MSPLESKLPNFSLNRKITVLMALVTVVVLGVVAAIGIPLELFPNGMVEPRLTVWVPWRDAPAPEVVDKVILPLETQLSTVNGIDQMDSRASSGRARISLQFKHGTDLDIAYREVRDRIERARADMPDDVDQVIIWKQDASGIPIFMFAVTIDPAIPDPWQIIEDEIKLPIERIDGVASVNVEGLIEKEILIELDRKRTAAAGLNIYELAQQLAGDNFSMASGHVRHGDQKLLMRSVSRYESVEELNSRTVAPNVRLSDIAYVHYDQPESKFRLRLEGKEAIAIQVIKEGQANTMEVSKRVGEVLDSMEDNPRLSLLGVEPFFDQGEIIMESLNTLLSSGRVGGLIALVVLFFFLRRIRMTLIATLSIPLSIVIGLTAMYFLGESLNVLTLLALMISVGLLVDNSVVVAENIFRLHRDGVPKRKACIDGAGEIALAVTMATLTTIIVFLPVSLVDGQGQFFLLRLSIPISMSLLGSLLVALVMIPLAVYVTLPPDGVEEKRSKVGGIAGRFYEATFGRMNRWYIKVLAVFMRRRLDLALILVVSLIATGAVMNKGVKFVQAQEEDRGAFEIDFRLPNNTTLEEAEEYFNKSDEIIAAMQEELDIDGWYHFHRSTYGEIVAWFNTPRTKKGVSPRVAANQVIEAMPQKAGVKYFVNEDDSSTDENKEEAQTFFLEGEDADLLEQTALALEDLLAKVDGVIGLKKVTDDSPSEMALVLDRDRMRTQGINPQVAAAVVGYALRGQSLPRFNYGGREIPVTVRFQEQDRDSLDELGDFAVPDEQGGLSQLSSISTPQYLSSATYIFRRNKRVSREVSVELEEGREEETRDRLMALASGIDLPEGVTWGGGFSRRGGGGGEDVQAMILAALLSVVFIYLLMGFLFESSILPLSIILTIPLAAMGVIWTHLVAGMDIDMLGIIGLILLIGVVVNNGIVLIDYVTRLRHEGIARDKAVILATERRFRPIMMTALTTIGGLIPLTLASTSSMGIGYKSFGLTLIGGLTTATLLTLLVVPVFYTLFDDAGIAVSSIVHRGLSAMRGGKSVAGAEPVAGDAMASVADS